MTMSKKKGKIPQFSLSLSRDCKIIPIKISLQEINMVFHCFFTFVSDFVIKNHKLGIVFNKLTTNSHLRFHFCNKSNPQYRNKNNAPPSASKTKKFLTEMTPVFLIPKPCILMMVRKKLSSPDESYAAGKSLPQETHPEQAEKPKRGDLQECYNKPSIIRLARSTDAGSNDAR